jgi:uncharacterized protein YkwD
VLKGIAFSIVGFIVISLVWMALGGISGTVSYENRPEIDTVELENEIIELTNAQRSKHGVRALSIDDRLIELARNHSQDMVQRNYFSHNSPEGNDPTDRAELQGFRCEKRVGDYIYAGVAENIFQNNLYDGYTTLNGATSSYDWNTMNEIAQSTVQGWMESPGHKENILDRTYDGIGIGVTISENDKVYITQNFC